MKTKLLKPFWLAAMLLLLCIVLPLKASAYDFMVDGLAYNINDDGSSVAITYTRFSSDNYNGLTSANIPSSVTHNDITYSVTSIGDYAFAYCSGLTSVTIGNSVTSIGSYAFEGCNGLTGTLTIPNSVTSIGDGAFGGCCGLTGTLTIPNSVSSIGEGAFISCSGLTSIIIPNSITEIGSNTFSDCYGLRGTLSIPNSVTSIGDYAFAHCTGLTSISIPNSVTSIGDGAFYYCHALSRVETKIEDPTSVSLGMSVFEGNSLNCILIVPTGTVNAYSQAEQWQYFSVIIDDATQYILFEDTEVGRICIDNWDTNGDNLLSFDEAANVTSLGEVFRGNESIKSFDELQYFTGLLEISNYAFHNCNNLNSLLIPNSVTHIGYSAFNGCSSLTVITIPNSVTSIGISAFKGCSGLTSVTIPNSVTSIGNSAFYGCSGLTSITIPNSVTTINNSVFAFCGLTGSLIIPNSITSIGNNAFYNCTGLTSLTIPNPVTEISIGAFSNCNGLTSLIWNAINCSSNGNMTTSNINTVTIGDEVQVLPDNFIKDSKVISVIIPNSVTSISSSAFSGCTGLTSITIPNSVTSIGSSTFSGCTGLTSITIPNSVTSIGSSAFSGCTGLTSITIPNSVTSIESGAFSNCNGLTSLIWNAINCSSNGNMTTSNIDTVTIGDEVQVLPYNFIKNSKIISVIIPSSVASIGSSAFSGCTGLTSITIPNTVTSIGSGAFSNCNGLTSINNYINHPSDVTLGNSVFAGIDKTNCTLYVTKGRGNEYRNAYQWKDFTNIVEEWMIPIESISISETELTLFASETVTLHTQIFPTDPSYPQLNWQSSDTTIASVNQNGLLTALTVGCATITVTTIDGSNLSATCDVTVTGITELALNKTSTDIYVGSSDTLIATITPNDVVNKNLLWQSSNPNVAIVRPENRTSTWQVLTKDFDQSQPFRRIRLKPQNPIDQWCCYLLSRQPNGVWDGDFSINTSSLNIVDNGNDTWGYGLIDVGDGWYEYEFSETVYFLEAQENVGEGYVQVLVEPAGETGVLGERVTITAKTPGTAIITATTTDGTNLSVSCQVNTTYEYALVADSIEHTRGENATVIEYPVELINANAISGLQFEVKLPEGVSLVFDGDVADVWLDDDRKARDHNIDASEVDYNHYIFMISSSTNKELKGHDGTLFYMKLLVDQYHNTGIYHINYTNLTLAEANETEHTGLNTSSAVLFNYMLGDADADAKVDVADYITTALYIMGRPTLHFYEDAANVHTANPDINVTDLTGITNIALGIRPTEILYAPALGNASPAGDMVPEMNVNVQKLDADRWMMSIELSNNQPMAAMQFDLQLPNGITYENASLTDRAGKLQVTDGTLPDGTVRLLASAFSADDIESGNGNVLNITLKGNPAVSGMAIFNNITLAERSLNCHELEPMTVPFTPTAIDGVFTYNEVRIYPENGCIVIESPYAGTAQLIRLNGISSPLKVLPGRNIYKVDKNEFHFVRFGNVNAKLRF